MKTFKTMLKVELKLSLRGVDMFIFAICMPILIIIILGMIYGENPAYEGAEYTFLEQSFSAVSAIAICAGGVMGLPLLVSDYRNKKILKRFKVTPVSPGLILFVHIVIYSLYSFVSLILVYLTAKIFFNYSMKGSLLSFLASYILVMSSMFSIGMMVGGISPNMKTASIIASLLYFPMLIFSGTTIPYEIMPSSLQKISNLLPLTQGIKLLKVSSLGLPVNNVLFSVLIIFFVIIFCVFISIKFFKWE